MSNYDIHLLPENKDVLTIGGKTLDKYCLAELEYVFRVIKKQQEKDEAALKYYKDQLNEERKARYSAQALVNKILINLHTASTQYATTGFFKKPDYKGLGKWLAGWLKNNTVYLPYAGLVKVKEDYTKDLCRYEP